MNYWQENTNRMQQDGGMGTAGNTWTGVYQPAYRNTCERLLLGALLYFFEKLADQRIFGVNRLNRKAWKYSENMFALLNKRVSRLSVTSRKRLMNGL
jgi:hypothetical protein